MGKKKKKKNWYQTKEAKKKKKWLKVKMPSLSNYQAAKCHTDNNLLFSMEAENSGELFLGGWNRKASIKKNMLVIDLTGTKTLSDDIKAMDPRTTKAFAKTLKADTVDNTSGILQLYIPDGGVPYWDDKIWLTLAEEIKTQLLANKDIMICCLGGHGRTGIAAAIISHLIDPEMATDNPIQWVRDLYCEKAVENKTQIDYIHEVLNLPAAPESLKGSKVHTYYAGNSYTDTYRSGQKCPECSNVYNCKPECQTGFHDDPEPAKTKELQPPTPNPDLGPGEITDAEFQEIEYGVNTNYFMNANPAEWAARFGTTW